MLLCFVKSFSVGLIQVEREVSDFVLQGQVLSSSEVSTYAYAPLDASLLERVSGPVLMCYLPSLTRRFELDVWYVDTRCPSR